MRISPVKSYRQPRYPTRPMLDAHPELLRLMPRRWQHPTIITAVATGCLLLASMRGSAQQDDKPKAQMVAPLFHALGDGRGAFGCIVTNPPVFLSEEDARQVITEEARRAGITFTPDSLTLENVRVPITDRFDMQPAGHNQTMTLTFDGENKVRHIAYEYVSSTDFTAWKTRNHQRFSTVDSYDLRGTADVLRRYLAQVPGDEHIGVFYDPVIGQINPWGQFRIEIVKGVPVASIRELAFWLDATVQIQGKEITLTREKQVVKFTMNSDAAQVDGRTVKMPVPVTVINGTSFAPVAFLAKTLGAAAGLEITPTYVTVRQPVTGEKLHLPMSIDAIIRTGSQMKRPARTVNTVIADPAITIAKQSLRTQVHAFLAWLKAEGVI